MKKPIYIIGILFLVLIASIFIYPKLEKPKPKIGKINLSIKKEFEFENGDIIFQTSTSSQSQAIQLATKSKYSHCGMIFNEGQLYVYEAIQPVTMTPIKEWIARGKNGKYVVKRLKNTEKLKKNYKKFCEACNIFYEKNYDLTFEWSDDKAYCSEMVWKSYHRGLGIELGKLQKLSDFDLTSKVVKEKLKQRYGNKIPEDEPVISPDAIFKSDLLETVQSN